MADDTVDISQGLQPSDNTAASSTTASASSNTAPAPPVNAVDSMGGTSEAEKTRLATVQAQVNARNAAILAQSRQQEGHEGASQGADNEVTPDPSRSPQFLRDSGENVRITPGDPKDLEGQSFGGNELTQAYVNPNDPSNIRVLQPNNMTQNIVDHEMAHTYMDQLEKQGVKFADVDPKAPYAYDPEKMQGKKDTDFSQEQLAKMVQDDVGKVSVLKGMAANHSLSQKDVDEYNKWKSAVGPVISQLAARIKGAKTYASQDDGKSVSDIPAMSNTRLDLSAGLQPVSKPTAGPKPAGF